MRFRFSMKFGLCALLAAAFDLVGCGPVCINTEGSCLSLRVEAAGAATANLGVWLGGSDAAGAPVAVAGTVRSSVGLPADLLIRPPAALSEVRKVSVQSTSAFLSGSTDLSWPAGEHIQSTVRLQPAAVQFTAMSVAPTVMRPTSVALLDAGPSKPPALLILEDHNVLLLPGNGDGSFGAARTIYQGNYPNALAVADLDRDGIADVAVSEWYLTGRIVILLGNADGTYKTPVSAGSDIISSFGVLYARDLDGDGQTDLLARGTNDGLGVAWNDGGRFAVATKLLGGQSSPGSSAQGSAAVADLNQDGLPDLITVAQLSFGSTGKIFVWMNRGHRQFDRLPEIETAGMLIPLSISAADLDGDAKIDLMVTSTSDSPFSYSRRLLIGDGQGGFKTAGETGTGSGGGLFGIATDLNGDLIPDLVLAPSMSGIQIQLGNGAGGFQPASGMSVTPDFVAAHDLNRDGRPDLVIVTKGVGPAPGRVTVLLNGS